MSVIFFDGFDFYSIGAGLWPGGRKWDQGSSGNFVTGRFGGQAIGVLGSVDNSGMKKTLSASHSSLIVGFAIQVNGYTGGNGPEYPSHPIFTFYDGNTAQCSIWIDHTTQFLEVKTGRGESGGDSIILNTGYQPPVSLWFYLECQVTFGTSGSGSIELRVDGQSLGIATGVATQQSGNSSANRFIVNSYNNYVSGVQGGVWNFDDFYVIDPTDGIGAQTYLGEVRVQTKYPDANGYETDFHPAYTSNNGMTYTNFNMVQTPVINYTENGNYVFSGTVGALDLYSIGNFTVSGQVFAVQENISFRKDDVGNRGVAPLLRTASQNYTGPSTSCYSSYTWAAHIWETNPNTGNPWSLTDLNQAEFGVEVAS